MGADDISLWPFAVKHMVWLYNRVPNLEGGFGGANADDNGPKVRQVQSNLDSEGAISCKRNEELMHNREVATKDMVPTPATQGGPCPRYSSS